MQTVAPNRIAVAILVRLLSCFELSLAGTDFTVPRPSRSASMLPTQFVDGIHFNHLQNQCIKLALNRQIANSTLGCGARFAGFFVQQHQPYSLSQVHVRLLTVFCICTDFLPANFNQVLPAADGLAIGPAARSCGQLFTPETLRCRRNRRRSWRGCLRPWE